MTDFLAWLLIRGKWGMGHEGLVENAPVPGSRDFAI